ncbi:hypothetical protein RB653_002816 [Dictyostelium firmibasis]|uniref:SSD domain-containing protein n=1 Tax=Dictyostelium firmibasis TaxID=79012 RepID=A0AAN7TYG3_9MYCE
MNKIIVFIFIIISIFKVIKCQSPYPYNTTLGCSMYGVTSSFVESKDFPPLNNTEIAPNTCQLTHPEYSIESCCNYNQTLILQTNMLVAGGIFGRCSSCMVNLYNLWCASSCSPYQKSFMVPTKVDNKTDQIIAIDFILHPDFANGLYNSCRDVHANGAQPFGVMFPTSQLFFTGVFSAVNPTFKELNWVFNTDGYNDVIIPCSEGCSCDQCRDACLPPPSYKDIGLLNDTIVQTHLLIEVPHLTIWIIWTFLLFLLSLLIGFSIWLIFKFSSKIRFFKDKKFKVIMMIALGILFICTVLIPFLTTRQVIEGKSTPSCMWEIDDGKEWNCSFAMGVSIYIIITLLLLSIVILACIIVDKTISNRNSRRILGISGGIINQQVNNDEIQNNNNSNNNNNNYSNIFQKIFYWYGIKITKRPIIVLLGCLIFTGCIGVGIISLQIETDPVKLWVSPDSRSAIEKQYFDDHFGPFYRVEQLILIPKQKNLPTIFDYDLFKSLIDIENQLMNITVVDNGGSNIITLNELCFQPTKRGCLVESITGIFQRDENKLDANKNNVIGWFEQCKSQLLSPECMDSTGVPVDPKIVLGGWSDNSTLARAFVTTFLLNNPDSMNAISMQWEQVWLNKIQEISNDPSCPFEISFNAQRSVQDELAREGNADIPTIIISYFVMFLYISLSLGSYYPFPRRFTSFFVRSRFALGLAGICIVACSIIISVGICSILRIKATLIISEVIPFLVLAIGVDNIFIIVNTFESLHVANSSDGHQIPTPEESFARTLAKVGPSIALASLSESFAFLLGSLTKMPAVKAFSFYASIAIFFDFLLQISAFACLLVLDTKRLQSRRVDCLPCLSLNGDNSDLEDDPFDNIDQPLNRNNNNNDDDDINQEEIENQPLINGEDDDRNIIRHNYNYDVDALNVVDGLNINEEPLPNKSSKKKSKKKTTLLKELFTKYYGPFLIHPISKLLIIIFFIAMLLFSINYAYQIPIGLDQKVALPRNSYLQAYFTNMNEYLEVGPPMYIVVKGNYDFSIPSVQNQFCTVGGCNNNSVINTFDNAPFISPGISSWLDDMLQWSNTVGCCTSFDNGTYCNSDEPGCDQQCFPLEKSGRPDPSLFKKYLPSFLNFTNTDQCPLAGLAYTGDVKFDSNGNIAATRFDAYHTTLRSQNDFINALATSYYLADHSDADVFTYSIFYCYFEAYLTIKQVAVKGVLLALGSVFLVSLAILMNPLVSLLVVICVGMTVIDLLAVMTLWDISLNAISVVNLIMGVGISIEFCVHIASTFIRSPKHYSRDEKVKFAISEMGANIFSGIFITKLLGCIVLAFSKSEIFIIYYFKMYISICLLAAVHGLILLPVLLSIFGTNKLSFEKYLSFKKDN